MLRAITICPDPEVAAQFGETIADIGWILMSRTLNHYPNEITLGRLVRATCPELVFLSVESMDRAFEVAATLEEASPGIQVVALSRSRDPQLLEQLIRSDIREFLLFPVCHKKLLEAANRANDVLAKRPLAIRSTDMLFSFLPSRAGVGTSTVALNTSVALSRHPDTNVLLADLDLNSGVIQFLLKINHRHSVIDAAQRSSQLDENIWPELVYSVGNLDVLCAGDFNPGVRIQVSQLHEMLDFARRHYRVISVDLSGNMEQYSLEVMRESKQIFLVCSPELSSVHLARKKFHYLRNQDLADRVCLLLNRAESDSMVSAAEIEEIVGLPVFCAFPNDHRGVLNAVFDGKPVDRSSALGQQFDSMAHSLVEGTPKPAETGHGLADRLTGWLSSRARRSLALLARRP